MKLSRMFATVAMAAMALGLAAPAAMAAEPVKIGVYLPLTGQNAFGGQLELNGVKLAQQAKPTVLGRTVELVVVDNKSDKVEAANAVKRLTERDNVCSYIGTYGSSLAMAGGEVGEKAGVPGVGTSCTNPLVTQGKKYYFRSCFIDPYQGAAAATYAFKNMGMKKAAILMDVANDYSVGLCAFFKRSYKKLGGEIVADLKYSSGDQDFTASHGEGGAVGADVGADVVAFDEALHSVGGFDLIGLVVHHDELNGATEHGGLGLLGELHAIEFELTAEGVLAGEGQVHADLDGLSGHGGSGEAKGHSGHGDGGENAGKFHKNPPVSRNTR